MRRLLLLVIVSGGLLAWPGSASATTCSAFSNQAAAQRAANTRDAYGDGIYCESLPCPCSRGTANAPAPARRSCGEGSTRGIIGGAVKCLKAGEFCARAHSLAYRRYHFRCATASDGRARSRRS
jgi:hypothetical protein